MLEEDVFITLSYEKRKSKLCKRGQREETILPGRSWFASGVLTCCRQSGRITAGLFLLWQHSRPYCSLTQELHTRILEQSGGRAEVHVFTPPILSLNTAYKRIFVCVFTMKKRSENWCQRNICVAILIKEHSSYSSSQFSAKRAPDCRPDEVVRCRRGSV